MRHIFMLFFLGLSIATTSLGAKNQEASIWSPLISEISAKLEERGLIEKKQQWQQNMQQIRRSLAGKTYSSNKFADTMNLALRSIGLPKDSLIPRDHQYAHEYRLEGSKFISGVLTGRRGKHRYVTYLLPNSKSLGLTRGDRVPEWFQFSKPSSKPVSITAKSNPIGKERKTSIKYQEVSYDQLTKQFSLQSMMYYKVSDKKTVSYIHLLNCHKSLDSALDKHLSRKKQSGHIIDLRDSYCRNSGKILNTLLSKKYESSKFYILVNQGTRLGAEHLIESLSRVKAITTIGETTAGLWKENDAVALTKKFTLMLPKGKEMYKPGLRPDVTVKDQFMFSEGQDTLLKQAIIYIQKNQNS